LIDQILSEASFEEPEVDWSQDRMDAENKFGEDFEWSDYDGDPWEDEDSPEKMKELFKDRMDSCTRVGYRKVLNNWRECWGNAAEIAGAAHPNRKDEINWVEKKGDGIYTLYCVAPFENVSAGIRPLKGYRIETTVKFYIRKGSLYFKVLEFKQFMPDGKPPRRGETNSRRDYYNLLSWGGGRKVEGMQVLEKIKDWIESHVGPIQPQRDKKKMVPAISKTDRAEEMEESVWMTPKNMGIAQKMDWSDDEGNEISDEQKLEYFKSRNDMYEVDEENGLVRLTPEEEWFGDDDNQEDWEREGYRNEIAYQNRWRDYTEPEEEMDDDEEDYRRDPYSPWNY
jgi:hypothetical protein